MILTDTAGLRATASAIEAEGIRRAQKAADEADLKILLIDAQDKSTAVSGDEETLVVFNKIDTAPIDTLKSQHPSAYFISAKTGDGLPALITGLSARVAGLFSTRTGPRLTRERHRLALQEAADALARSLQSDLPELAAEDMRLAVRAIGKITGRVHIEDLLDAIFRDFCIGK